MMPKNTSGLLVSNSPEAVEKMDHGTIFFCQLRSCGDPSQYQDVSFCTVEPEASS
jgi:hypothetical protein